MITLTNDHCSVPVQDFSLVRIASNDILGRTAVSRSLTELEDELKRQGLELPSNNYGKQELLDTLGKASWERKHPGELMPQFEQPMLIQNLKDKDPEFQRNVWNSPEWAAEQKRNGIRCIVYLGSSPKAHSRNISVTDYLPEGMNRQLTWLLKPMPGYEGTSLDGELISIKKEIDTRPYTKNKGTITNNVLQAVMGLLTVEKSIEAQVGNGMPLRYVLYDILTYKGKDIKGLPYSERREYLTEVSVALQSTIDDPTHVILNASITEGKREFYEQCIQRGEEGCVLKYLKGKYKGGQTRSPDQLKVKREIEVDGVVVDILPPNSGRFVKEGLLGGLVFACKDQNSGQWYRIAAVSNVDLEFRRKWSIQNENGEYVGVKPGLIGTVWEIQGHDWTKNIQLAHARIVRSRNEGPDSKAPEEAVFDVQAVIREQMSREGGEGQIPQPVLSDPPENVDHSNPVQTPLTRVPEKPTLVPPRVGKKRTWRKEDGSIEEVTLIRRGDRNSRVMTSEGEKLVPNVQLA